jgi:transporter family protein
MSTLHEALASSRTDLSGDRPVGAAPVFNDPLEVAAATVDSARTTSFPFVTRPALPPVEVVIRSAPRKSALVLESIAGTLKTRWFWYSIASALCWTGWAFTAKLGSKEIPPTTMQFVSAFGFLFVAVAVFPVKKVELRGSWRGGRFALISGVLLGVGGMALYGAYRASHNSSVVTAVTSLYPVITVLLAVSFLREKINRLQTLGILFAAIAILLLCH